MSNEKSDHLISRRDFIRLTSGASAIGVMSIGGWGFTEFLTESDVVDEWKKSVCRYCGTGCGVQLGLKDGKIVRVKGDAEAHNKGVICIKGSTLMELPKLPNRQLFPQIRKNGKLERATWDEAMTLVANKFKSSIQSFGKDSVAFYGSGQLYTEESYTANKLFKAGIGTNNVDGNPRLCMASAAVGYVQTFGKDEPLGAYEDIDHAECFFIIGANPYECHPPLWERIMIRKKANPNVKIIVVDPRKTETAQRADIYLSVTPGADLMLLNAMAHYIVSKGLTDSNFIKNHISFNDGNQKVDFNTYSEFLKDYTPESVANELGVTPNQIREIAHLFATSKATMSLWTMGINQRTQGVFLNNCLSSLHLITGQICRPGATPLSLTGQSNACGGVRDTGSLSHILPGGRLVKNKTHRAEMEKLWKLEKGALSPKPGYDAVNLFRAMNNDKVKTALVMCTNPAQSMPNREEAVEGMKKCFLVVSDVVSDSETLKYADVVLPAALYVEKTGVYGQTERRYQLIEKLIEPAGEARSDLSILVDLSERLGLDHIITNKTPEDVWNEWRKISASSKYNFEGITYDRLKKERGIQWPCPTEDHKGTVRRYTTGDPFVAPNKKIQFYGKKDNKAVVYLRPYIQTSEQKSNKFPFFLTTGRVVSQWHTGTLTNKIKELKNYSGVGRFFIHPVDATQKGLNEGERIIVRSKYGKVEGEVSISDKEQVGTLFASFFDSKFLINNVVSDQYDPVSKEPEYKVTAINVEKVGA